MWRQKRLATGIGPSYNDTMGAVDAGLQNEARLAQIASNRSLEQQRLDMAQDQINKQNRAATWSGIGQGIQMGGNLYMGSKLLDIYNSKLPPTSVPNVAAGASNGGILTAGGGIPLQSAPSAATSIPYGTTAITGNVGEGLGVASPSATSAAWTAPLQTAGLAAGGAMALNEGGKYVAEKTGLPRPIATALAPVIGPTMKVVEVGKSLLDSIF